MLAVRKIAHGIGHIELQDVPEPHPGPGQVVVEVDSAGICGTDLHIYLGEFETMPPVTIGHELAGTIVELGLLSTPASNLHRVPDGLDLEAAALTEPLACTVYGVLETAGVRAGDNVVLTGPGPIGLLAMQLAKIGGATVVMIGTSLDVERLKLAKALGADRVINIEEIDNVVDAVGDLFGAPGADLVIECSGAAPAAKWDFTANPSLSTRMRFVIRSWL